MARQNIPVSLRHALWATYHHQCFYCRKRVTWDTLEVDHILPISLLNDTGKLQRVLQELRLDERWDLRSLENLVPACPTCNARKLDRLPEPNQLVLFLTQAREAAPRVRLLEQKYRAELKRDTLMAQLSIALTANVLTNSDVDAILQREGGDFAKVSAPAVATCFIDVPLNQLRPGDAYLLLDKTVRMGGNSFTGLELKDPSGESVKVYTLREYTEALARGCNVDTNFANKMSAFFKEALGVQRALAAFRPHSQSFLETPRVGVADLGLIPTALYPYLGRTAQFEELIATYPTLQHLVDAGEARVTSVSSNELRMELSGCGMMMRDILRADLDGDGYEDMLVSIYGYATGGTHGYGIVPIALTRRSFQERFSVTEINPSPMNERPADGSEATD